MRAASTRALGARGLGGRGDLRGLGLLAALGIVVVSGCVPRVVVRKVSPEDLDTPGIRYALPRPFLRVTPGPGGAVEVDVVCLPDPSRTYAIDARSVLGAQALDVQVERGLLRRVAFREDPTASLERTLDAAGSIAEGWAEARGTTSARAETRADELREEARERRAAAQRDVATARRKLEVARAELAVLESSVASASAVLSARVALAAAEAELREAERRLAEVAGVGTSDRDRATRGTRRDVVSGDLEGPPDLDASDGVPGPVVYAIVERPGEDGRPTVALEAVRGPDGAVQRRFETVVVPRPSEVLPPPRLEPEGGVYPVVPSRARLAAARSVLEVAEARLRELRDGKATPLSVARAMADVAEARIALEVAGRLELTVVSTRPLSRLRIEEGRSALERRGDNEGDVGEDRENERSVFEPPSAEELRRRVALVSATTIRVVLPEGIPDGEYALVLGFEYEDGAVDPRAAPRARSGSGTVRFTVERPNAGAQGRGQ